MIFILYVLMCLIFGTTFLFIKIGLNVGWSPTLFASLRFFIAGGIVLFMMQLLHRKINYSWEVQREIIIIALFMTTIPFTALYQSEQYITSGMAAILVATAPMFIVLLNWLINKNKVMLSQVFGISLSLLGVFLIFLPALGYNQELSELKAQLSLIFAEVAFAYGSIRAKRLLSYQINPFVFNGLQMVYGGLFLFVFGLIGRETLSFPLEFEGWIILAYFIVIASIIANGIYYWLMKNTNALFPSTWTYVSPVIALILGYFILDETFGRTSLLGAVFVIIGVVCTNADLVKLVRNKSRKLHAPRLVKRV